MKLPRFRDHLKEKMKDPYFKGGWEAWGDAIKTEIAPRDREIFRLNKKIKKLESCLKKRGRRG